MTRLLFYKPDLAWPRRSGHDVHTFHLVRALGRLGARVALATDAHVPPEALAGLELDRVTALDEDAGSGQGGTAGLTGMRERFRSYWGIPPARIVALARTADRFAADATVVAGLGTLPMFEALERTLRVWYAGDEWVWHHLSQLRRWDASWAGNLRDAVVKGCYERAFARCVDRAWVVSPPDARAMRWLAGIRAADVVPNGVDADFFAPCVGDDRPSSAIFWGRLDFGPNIQALAWFIHHVWRPLQERRPGAVFTIAGFSPTTPVVALAQTPGVRLEPDVPDIRVLAAEHAVVVLPFVSGGGIKNKLLEAAAMGKAIVASPRAGTGLLGEPPLVWARRPREWTDALLRLWDDPRERDCLGAAARAWVTSSHTWEQAAAHALASIESNLGSRRR